MVREELVRRLLTHLRGYLDELGVHREVSLDDYRAAAGPRRSIERLLQLIVEAAVDINVHVVTEEEGSPPPDYRSSFFAAARYGLIPSDLAERLAPSAGLRNALTHDYADIDDAIVHGSIIDALDDFGAYASIVTRWLDERTS
jgi:uncharacterized protein YutE (UPF0331/DUF86 family)